MASIRLDKHDPRIADAKVNVSMSRLPSLNDCVVTKQMVFFLCANSIIFISTVGFSNEDNCCQSQGIGNLIKKKPLKGVFRVD